MKLITLTIILLLSVTAANAVMITEIMYDPSGSDTNREWIELYNEGSEVNIENWRFRENNVNHHLSLYQGSYTLPKGGFAIIVDDPDEFLKVYSYSGTILDSAFSLKNSGEEIALLDDSLTVIDSVDYDDISEEGYSIIYEDVWKQGPKDGSPGKKEIKKEIPEFSFIGVALVIIILAAFRKFT